jgi:hypothetical protein
MEGNPILWVSSGTYFSWLHRRFTELENVHQKLSRIKPQNYGLLTLIILHLMRYVMVTPLVKTTFFQDAMRDLQFQGIIGRFGMFFLHDFDLSSCLLKEIEQEDPEHMNALYGPVLKRAKLTTVSRRARPLQLLDTGGNIDFPWGRAPSWPRIQELLQTECSTFLRPWEFQPELEDDLSQRLFIVFTRDLWLSLATHIICKNQLPQPQSFLEAMYVWTVVNVQSLLGKEMCHFLPSAYGLVGKFPKNLQRMSFLDRRAIFFPALQVTIPEKSIWKPYTEKRAYIGMYHGYLRTWSEQKVDELHSQLDAIFSNLQCLPPCKPLDAGSTVIWSMVSGKIQFVTNSSFYRIAEVGDRCSVQPSTRPQTSSRQLLERIHDEYGGSEKAPICPRIRQRSIKARNKRNPPPNSTRRRTARKAQVYAVILFQSATCLLNYRFLYSETENPTTDTTATSTPVSRPPSPQSSLWSQQS